MTLHAYDINGYVGDVGTNTGWDDLASALRESHATDLRSFAQFGYTEDPRTFAQYLREVGERTTLPPEMRSSWDNLLGVAQRAEGILIVSNGVED